MCPPLWPHLFSRDRLPVELRGVCGVFLVSWGAVSPSRVPCSQRIGEEQGEYRMKGSAGNRKQVLIVIATPLPLGLTCPGAAQMCSSAGVASTNAPPQYQVSWRGAGAPSSLPLHLPRQAPPPGWPHPPGPREIQELQDPRCSQGLFASLGKSRTRACHTSKAEGQQGHFSGGSQLEDLATRGGRGSMPLLGATSKRDSPPTTEGQS